MNIIWRTLTNRQALKNLYPELCGRVFHITSISNLIEIIETGEIKHNQEGQLKSNGTYNAYFKNRGCVSFCDFHNNQRPRKVREAALTKYNIFNQGDGEQFAYLFLHAKSHEKLITWEKWKQEEAWSEMVVPHLESGYPGHVPLSEIQEIQLINITISSNIRGIAARLAAARESQMKGSCNVV